MPSASLSACSTEPHSCLSVTILSSSVLSCLSECKSVVMGRKAKKAYLLRASGCACQERVWWVPLQSCMCILGLCARTNWSFVEKSRMKVWNLMELSRGFRLKGITFESTEEVCVGSRKFSFV